MEKREMKVLLSLWLESVALTFLTLEIPSLASVPVPVIGGFYGGIYGVLMFLSLDQ